jgi:hypothetical protein
MKNLIYLLSFLILMTFSAGAQTKSKVEVLYFKANLACCQAKACNALESDIQKIINSKYPNGNVAFREVKLVDEVNKDLVAKYSAKSQTVVIIRKKKKEKSLDVSYLVRKYLSDHDLAALEKELTAKIDEYIK